MTQRYSRDLRTVCFSKLIERAWESTESLYTLGSLLPEAMVRIGNIARETRNNRLF